jgi:hypothetical protein
MRQKKAVPGKPPAAAGAAPKRGLQRPAPRSQRASERPSNIRTQWRVVHISRPQTWRESGMRRALWSAVESIQSRAVFPRAFRLSREANSQ